MTNPCRYPMNYCYIGRILTDPSVLLFVLWYCHKRGREVRLGKEASDASAGPSNTAGDADDDTREPPIVIKKVGPEEDVSASEMPRPPIGPDAPK